MSFTESQLRLLLAESSANKSNPPPPLVVAEPYAVFVWTIELIHRLILEDNHRTKSGVSWADLKRFGHYKDDNRNLYRFVAECFHEAELKSWFYNKTLTGGDTVISFFKDLLEYVGITSGMLLSELHAMNQSQNERFSCYVTRFENIVYVLEGLYANKSLTDDLKFELFARGVNNRYKMYLWSAAANITAWKQAAKKLERFGNLPAMNEPKSVESSNLNPVPSFFQDSVDEKHVSTMQVAKMIAALDEEEFDDLDPAEKRSYMEMAKDTRNGERNGQFKKFKNGKALQKMQTGNGSKPHFKNGNAKKQSEFSNSSFAKSTLRKMRITAPAYFVLKGLLDEIDPSIWNKVEKAFLREKMKGVNEIEEDDFEDSNEADVDVIEPILSSRPSEMPLSFHPSFQDCDCVELMQGDVALGDQILNEEEFEPRFSACFFPKVQVSTLRGEEPKNVIVSGIGKVLVDSGAATSLISSSVLEKLGITHKINSESKASFVNANGKHFSSLGRIAVNLGVFPHGHNAKPVPFGPCKFHVIERDDDKIILGMDWIYKNRCVIDPGSERCSVTSPFGWVRILPIRFVVGSRRVSSCALEEEISWSGDYWKLHHPDEEQQYPLTCAKDISIAGDADTLKLDTDLKVSLPEGVFCEVRSKNNKVKISGGVFDQNYEGSLGLVLHNPSKKRSVIKKGEEICSLVFRKIDGDCRSCSSGIAEDERGESTRKKIDLEKFEELMLAVLERLSFLGEKDLFNQQ